MLTIGSRKVPHPKKHGLYQIPQIHGFRTAFALKMLREEVDVHTIARLLGNAYTQILYRYLKVSGLDTERAFKKVSPVDKGLRGC